MKYLNDEEELFFKKINSDITNVLNNNKIILLNFLDLRKQEIIKYLASNKVNLYFSGGYNDSEYKRCIISDNDIIPDFKIDILKLKYNKRYLKLNHRIVLGSILSLGLKREVIGDIVFDNEDIYVCVSSHLSSYIIDNLKVISNNPVEFIIYNEEINNIINYDIKKIIVSSLRLDTIISSIYNISRNESKKIIEDGYVKINHSLILNTSYNIKREDILSIRGKGRVKIGDILGETKKERIILEIYKYI